MENNKNHLEQIYSKISENEKGHRTILLEDHPAIKAFSKVLHYGAEFESLAKLCDHNFAVILLKHSIIDFQRSASSAINGRRIEAYIILRMHFEKFLFFIILSSNETNFRLWRIGQKDMSWSLITDENKGIFSKPFTEAFCPEFVELRTQFRSISIEIYRECSEIVHGNYDAISNHSAPPNPGVEWVEDWSKKAQDIQSVCVYLWLCRFADTPTENLESIRDLVRDLLGNIAAVRNKLGL